MTLPGRKRICRWIVVILLVAVTAPAWASDVRKKSETAPGKVSDDFVIGPQDVLAVNVWKEPEISRVIPVRPDGKISLPLVGELTASGTTARQLQGVITEALKNYLANPEVTVIVQEVKSNRVNVVGEVMKPGSYEVSGPLTVLDAIAMAGGLKDFAKKKKIYVLRPIPERRPVRLPFNYKDVIKGKKVEQNIQLQARDTVVVP